MARHPHQTLDGHVAKLKDAGLDEIDVGVPIIGMACAHDARDLTITAKGNVGVMIRCKCGLSGVFVPVPERQLKSHETDAIVALARESAWKPRGRLAPV